MLRPPVKTKAVDVDIPAALKSSLELFGCKFNTHLTSEFHCEDEKTVVDLETEEVQTHKKKAKIQWNAYQSYISTFLISENYDVLRWCIWSVHSAMFPMVF